MLASTYWQKISIFFPWSIFLLLLEVSVIQSCSQGVNRVLESLLRSFPDFPKTHLKIKYVRYQTLLIIVGRLVNFLFLKIFSPHPPLLICPMKQSYYYLNCCVNWKLELGSNLSVYHSCVACESDHRIRFKCQKHPPNSSSFNAYMDFLIVPFSLKV